MNLATTMAVTGVHTGVFRRVLLYRFLLYEYNRIVTIGDSLVAWACSGVADVALAVFVIGVVVVNAATASFVAVFCYIFVLPLSWFLIVNCWLYILGIKDPEEKKKAMMELFESLPRPNRHTSIYLLDHLRRYATWSIALEKCSPGWKGWDGVTRRHVIKGASREVTIFQWVLSERYLVMIIYGIYTSV